MKTIVPLLLTLALLAAACDANLPLPQTDGDHDGETSNETSDVDATEAEAQPLPPNYLIIAPEALMSPAADYAAFRETTGYRPVVIPLGELATESFNPSDLLNNIHATLEAALAELGSGEDLYVLLLGTAPVPAQTYHGAVPAIACQNDYGDCHTDNRYADLDNDSVPEVILGRLPSDNPAEIAAYRDKVAAHEAGYEVGPWNRRLTLYAGEAGFGDTIDGMLEFLTFMALGKLDVAFDVVGAYQVEASAYHYRPFEEKVNDLYTMGSIVTVYIGHGSPGSTAGLDLSDLAQMQCQHRNPAAFFFACSNGDYTTQSRSIAEEILFGPQRPLISFAASDVSHPYGNAVLSYETQRALLNDRPATFGRAALLVKRYAMENSDDFRELADSFAVSSGEMTAPEIPVILAQHLNLYNFFGDPATAVRYPAQQARFTTVTGRVQDGQVSLTGACDNLAHGQAWVSLEANRETIVRELLPIENATASDADVQENWRRANDKEVAGVMVDVENGIFSAMLSVPDGLPNTEYYLKVYADDGAKDCFGGVVAP